MDQQILELLYQGLVDSAVARKLGLGHRTVQRRVQHLMELLQVRGRVALGAKAQELGLLSTPGSSVEPARVFDCVEESLRVSAARSLFRDHG